MPSTYLGEVSRATSSGPARTILLVMHLRLPSALGYPFSWRNVSLSRWKIVGSTYSSFKNQERTSTATKESTPSSTRGASVSTSWSPNCKMTRNLLTKHSVLSLAQFTSLVGFCDDIPLSTSSASSMVVTLESCSVTGREVLVPAAASLDDKLLVSMIQWEKRGFSNHGPPMSSSSRMVRIPVVTTA